MYAPQSTMVRNLIILCAGVFGLEFFSDTFHILAPNAFASYGALVPVAVWKAGQFWRVVTYIFLHAGFMHIALNMLGLWMFGPAVARELGDRKFLGLFMTSGIVAGLFSGLFYLVGGAGGVPVVGASGALYGVMFAFARLYPTTPILMFFVVPVQARYAVLIMGAMALFSGVSGGGGNVAHLTHLFGIAGGWLFLKVEGPLSAAWEGLVSHAEIRETKKVTEKLLERREYMDSRVDPILQKISKHGMESLTRQEREVLKRASEMKADNLVDLRAWRRDRDA